MKQVKFNSLSEFLASGEQVGVVEEIRKNRLNDEIFSSRATFLTIPVVSSTGVVVPKFRKLYKKEIYGLEDDLSYSCPVGFYSEETETLYGYNLELEDLGEQAQINLSEVEDSWYEKIINQLNQIATETCPAITQEEKDEIKSEVAEEINENRDLSEFIRELVVEEKEYDFTARDVRANHQLTFFDLAMLESDSSYFDKVVNRIWLSKKDNYLRTEHWRKLRKVKKQAIMTVPKVAEQVRMLKSVNELHAKSVQATFIVGGEVAEGIKLDVSMLLLGQNEYSCWDLSPKDRKKFADDPSIYDISQIKYRGKTIYSKVG